MDGQLNAFYSHSCLIVLPSHTVCEKGHTIRHCSTKLHNSLECGTKTCTEKSTNVLFFYSNFVSVEFDNFLFNDEYMMMMMFVCHSNNIVITVCIVCYRPVDTAEPPPAKKDTEEYVVCCDVSNKL